MLPPPFRAMDPGDDLGWHAVADWLEEHGEADRAELLRLTRSLVRDLTHPDRPAREARQMELLAAGVEPCVAEMTNGTGMEFVYIPAGVFLMGSPPEEAGHQANEGPVHEVEITRGFWMGKYPVTQAEYGAVTRKNPSLFSAEGISGNARKAVEGLDTSRFPVDTVSFEDALSFCRRLDGQSARDRNRKHRLPTEAEWEYACRGGPSSRPFDVGITLRGDDFAHYAHRPTPVGLLLANAFGLHDMHRNVWEWCADWYSENWYQKSEREDPRGAHSGSARVLRGGSFRNLPSSCRAAYRYATYPQYRSNEYGFRVCFTHLN